MVRINRIYTRTGDKGQTGLLGGRRVQKDSLRVSAYGEVDELNSVLGLARTLALKNGRSELSQQLACLQNELFDAGSELATPPGEARAGMPRIATDQAARLEEWIDALTKDLPELQSFVLPGGNELNAVLHIARSVCRRAERSVLALSRHEPVEEALLVYFNRLSDLLFAMARYESLQAGQAEYLWKPGSS